MSGVARVAPVAPGGQEGGGADASGAAKGSTLRS